VSPKQVRDHKKKAITKCSLQASTIDRLAAACSVIETALAPGVGPLLVESRSDILTVWSAVQRMRTWLQRPTPVSIYDEVSSGIDSTWSAADLIRAVQIMRLQPGADHIPKLLRVMRLVAGEQIPSPSSAEVLDVDLSPLRDVVTNASAEEIQSILPVVLAGCATGADFWRRLLNAILASTRNGMQCMIDGLLRSRAEAASIVRAHSAGIINALTFASSGSFTETLDTAQSLRLFVERNVSTKAVVYLH